MSLRMYFACVFASMLVFVYVCVYAFVCMIIQSFTLLLYKMGRSCKMQCLIFVYNIIWNHSV